MSRDDFIFIFLVFTTIIMEALIYILFEFQNAWPFNEKIFPLLKTISITGIIISILLSVFFRRPYMSLASLIVSVGLISIISRSEENITSLSVTSVAAFLIFLSAKKIASLKQVKTTNVKR